MMTTEQVVQIKRRHEDELLARPGVTGVDVGYKYIKGQRTSAVAIRVLVTKKGPVPAEQQIPREIEGVLTDVIERIFGTMDAAFNGLRITQGIVDVVRDYGDKTRRISQMPLHVAWANTGQESRVSQMPVHAALASTSQNVRLSQMPIHLATKVPIPIPAADVLPYLFIPQGMGQAVDELAGSSSIGETTVECIDLRGELKAVMADPDLLGSDAEFRLGFPGMNLTDFILLEKLQVIRAGWTSEGRVVFHLQDRQRAAKYYIWTNGGPTPWGPGQPTPQPPIGPAFTANAEAVQDANPRFVQGNPMDLLLVVLQNEMGVGQASSDPSTWTLYDPVAGTGLINPNVYVDVPVILALRDGQFSGDWVEFVVKNQEDGKNWVESQLLKPLGLNFVVRSTGKLTLVTMKSPPSTTPATWNANSIDGMPGVDIWDIVNVLQVRFNTDDAAATQSSKSYKSDTAFQDDASIQKFKQQMIQQAEFTGMRTRRGAVARAFILSDRMFRRHGDGTPVYTAKAQLRNLPSELYEYVSLTHPLVPDLWPLSANAGKLGLTNVLCQIIDRQPNYADAKPDYKLIDCRFVQATKLYKIAPDGTADWTSSSPTEKATYLFISDDTGKQSNGDTANTIF